MVERAIAQRRMLTDYFLLKQGSRNAAARRGSSATIEAAAVSQQLQRGGTNATVLLEGESGTGRLFARALRAQPARRRSVVAINCAAIPESLLETELFGHEGRVHRRLGAEAGRFELASRHAVPRRIGELPLGLQAKILRARGESFNGSAAVTLNMDVRVVAATNRRLKARSRRGGSARISTSASRSFRSRFLRARGPATSRRWRGTSSKFCRDLRKKTLLFTPAALDPDERVLTRGPATCANCRTASNARSSSATRRRSSRAISACHCVPDRSPRP